MQIISLLSTQFSWTSTYTVSTARSCCSTQYRVFAWMHLNDTKLTLRAVLSSRTRLIWIGGPDDFLPLLYCCDSLMYSLHHLLQNVFANSVAVATLRFCHLWVGEEGLVPELMSKHPQSNS